MAPGVKAIIKHGFSYGVGKTQLQAPAGEYAIESDCNCIGFCDCNGERAFTLSLDAFLQNLNEGRILLKGSFGV